MTRRDLRALALIIAVVTLVFFDVLFLGRSFFFRDVTRFYFPMKKVTRDIILAGEFPSWNPMYSEGQPLAANPEFGVFYPPNWLLLLPDYELMFRLEAVLHFYVAAIGAYLLLRSWRLRIESAMFGAFAFTFGGLLLSTTNLFPYLLALPWVPWLMLFLSRALRVPSRRDIALASLFFALILLSGEPVMAAQVGIIAAAYALWPRDGQATFRVRIAVGAAVVALALLLASVQLVPAIDHVRDSVRSRPFEFSLVSFWSTPPLRAFELLVPGLFGFTGAHAQYYWGTAAYRWVDPFFLSIYPGLLVTALGLAAILLRRRGSAAIAIGLAAGFVLAIGSHTPLLKMLYDAHLFSSFRFPEKFWMLALLPVPFLAAFAFEEIVDGESKLARVATIIASLAAAICAVLIVVALLPRYPAAFARFWGIEMHPLREAMAEISLRTWIAGLGRAACVVVLLAARRRMRPELWSRIAIAVLVIDLAIERPFVAETIDHSFFATRPASVPRVGDDVRVFHQADWYDSTAIARRYLDLPEMYWVIRNGGYPHVNAPFGIASALNRDIDRTALMPTSDLLASVGEIRKRTPQWVPRLSAISNAGYRAIFMPPEQAGRGESIRPIAFVPVPANPRFYFADLVARCTTRDEFVSFISGPQWTRRAACGSLTPFVAAPGEVIAWSQRSNRARVSVRSSGDALLVCSITRHKYWTATIDGRPAPLIPVNLAYQGLRIGPGPHEIEMRYDNPLLRRFGVVSLVTLLAIAVLAIIPPRDRAQL